MKSIDSSVFIARGAVVTGDVVIGKDSSVWFNAVIRGDHRPVVIGSETNIQDLAVLHVDYGHDLIIGDRVTIGHSAIVHGCTIGNDVMIGMGSIIMNGAVIGDNCLIGAGALVTQGMEVPEGSLVFGSPAKVKRRLTPEEIRVIHDNAEDYVQLAKNGKEGKYDG